MELARSAGRRVSMATSFELKSVTTPPADGTRVAAIRSSLSVRDDEALTAFGERARLEVAASIQRILAEVRSNDAAEAAELLARAKALVSAHDPDDMRPRGLFGGRKGRIQRFQARFGATSEQVQVLAAEMAERADRLNRRVGALDRLVDQAKAFILELDAYVEAGELAREAASAVSADARDALEARLDLLAQTRRCAVEQLSLVRTVQNVDTPLALKLGAAAAELGRWRSDWTDLLGLSPQRKKHRIRPDQPTLAASQRQTLDALEPHGAALVEGRGRRSEAEAEMEASTRGLALPRRRLDQTYKKAGSLPT